MDLRFGGYLFVSICRELDLPLALLEKPDLFFDMLKLPLFM